MSEVFVIDLAKAKPESAPSAKPPKGWWDKKYQEVKQGNPDYSDEQIRGTVGSIWYQETSPSQKKTRREKEGKTYRKVKKSMIHVINIEELNPVAADTLVKAEVVTKVKAPTEVKTSTKTDDIDRDGQNVGNLGAKDYFGKRDKAKKNPKVDKNRPQPKPLKKSDYFGIYIHKKQPLGGEHHSTHLSGVTSIPVQPVGGPPERDIEVRPAMLGTDVAAANQDAYDKATQGGLVRLQRGDMEVSYMSVDAKADGYLLGYGGSTPDRAEFASGQGDQSQLRSVPVLGQTEWTAEIIPKKTMKKSNPTEFKLFPTSPEDPELVKSITQQNLVQTNNNSVSRAEIPNPGDQKYYDFANAFIEVLHKSFEPDSIFNVLQEQAKTNELLAKSMDVCRIDPNYVLQCASHLHKEKHTIGATDYAVQKALSHFASV